MREIKFRAWENQKKIMFKVDNLKCGSGNAYGWGHDKIGPNNDSYQVMEYTGLKDKNGLNEVYEGDVLSVQWSFDGRKSIGIVSWSDNECRWVIKDINSERWHALSKSHLFPEPHEIEVIGSIFENPELVKEIDK